MNQSIVSQVREAFSKKRRLASAAGLLLGGFVPLASFVLAHQEIDRERLWSVPTALVAGGLLYSAKTVYAWGAIAFLSRLKSAGFVVLLEGVMIASQARWLSLTALAYLIIINGLATGCNLSLEGKQATERRSRAERPLTKLEGRTAMGRPHRAVAAAKAA